MLRHLYFISSSSKKERVVIPDNKLNIWLGRQNIVKWLILKEYTFYSFKICANGVAGEESYQWLSIMGKVSKKE